MRKNFIFLMLTAIIIFPLLAPDLPVDLRSKKKINVERIARTNEEIGWPAIHEIYIGQSAPLSLEQALREVEQEKNHRRKKELQRMIRRMVR